MGFVGALLVAPVENRSRKSLAGAINSAPYKAMGHLDYNGKKLQWYADFG